MRVSLSSPSIRAISSPLSSKSKIWLFSMMRSRWTDLGMVTTPAAGKPLRTAMWAADYIAAR